MPDRPKTPDATAPKGVSAESYARIVARPALVLMAVLALAAWQFRPRPEPTAPAPPTPPTPALAKVVEPPLPAPSSPKPRKTKRPPRPTTAAPMLDRAAVEKAEISLDQASRERAHADARLAEAERALQAATLQAATDLARSRSLASKVRDPSARLSAATAKGGFLKGERDKLKTELAALGRVEQPKAKALLAKSAVAKPTNGAEYHFELRGDRVSFIDLDRLVEMVKTDARIRLRSGVQRGRLGATVGPVGSFSLRYELGRSLPQSLSDMLETSRESSYNLLGWEVLPEANNRGETFEATRASASNYARAIHRLSPGRDTVTMWIYADAFPLYRRLRDELQARGLLVAARPLPDGTAIRGSPSGSVSAGQ